jgi:prepilin-type processing-associated H-X9-DG protein
MAILAGMLLPALGRARDEARKVRCQSNLSQLAKAANLYLLKYGGNECYPEPARSFRGTDGLAVLYWTDIIDDPTVFHCPAQGTAQPLQKVGTGENGALLVDRWDGSLTGHCIEYAGRGRSADADGQFLDGASTESFTESALGSDQPFACDLNENHSDGINVVFFDSHVEFLPDAGQYVGRGSGFGMGVESALRFMDHPDPDNTAPVR